MRIKFPVIILLFFSCTAQNNDKQALSVAPHQMETLPVKSFSTEHLLGKFNQKKDSSFSLVPLKYCNKEGMYLRKETIAAFIKMYEAAKKDGVNLKIISATRNFNEQKAIWEAKWNGSRLVNGKNLAQSIKDPLERAKTILRYSSMPSTSRHHWGTDMDLNSLENKYFNAAEGRKIYDWLKNNAAGFGFCQPYSVKNDNRPNGYEEEKWHWSYMPLSSVMLKEYLEKVKPEDISGFAGAETASRLNVIENYVNGVNPECR